MKHLLLPLKIFAVMALVTLAAGCASTRDASSKQDLVMAAGFKVITPSTPDQRALLNSLPPDKVSSITYHGKPYYVLPDVANNRAYVGGPQEYNAYRVNRANQNLANEDLNAAKWDDTVSQMDNWNGWSGTYCAGEPAREFDKPLKGKPNQHIKAPQDSRPKTATVLTTNPYLALQALLVSRHCRLQSSSLAAGKAQMTFLLLMPSGLDPAQIESDARAKLPKDDESQITIQAA